MSCRLLAATHCRRLSMQTGVSCRCRRIASGVVRRGGCLRRALNEGSLRQAGDVGPLFHWRTGAVEVTGLACRAAPGGLHWSLQVTLWERWRLPSFQGDSVKRGAQVTLRGGASSTRADAPPWHPWIPGWVEVGCFIVGKPGLAGAAVPCGAPPSAGAGGRLRFQVAPPTLSSGPRNPAPTTTSNRSRPAPAIAPARLRFIDV